MYLFVGMLLDGRSWLRPSLKPFSLPSLLSICRAAGQSILIHCANVIVYLDGTFHSSELCEALGLPWGFAYLRYSKMTFRNVGCLRNVWCVLCLRMCGCRTLASRAHLGCIDVAKLPSRQFSVSRRANPHFFLRSCSVEDLPQYSVAQVRLRSTPQADLYLSI